jgi:bacterial/archaeal transporter family protein
VAVNFDIGYIGWALIAMAGYSVFTPLAQIATQQVPSTVVALVANTMLAVAALIVVLVTNSGGLAQELTGGALPYMLAAGAFLIVGILSYYQALAAGPISVVTPIYGMFLVGSSVIGIAFLGESLTLQKGAGIVLAIVAVYLTATG